tara:strand:- start:312 stop:446 length:135 start_codon:yes stop_codon:yes gene_type:complete
MNNVKIISEYYFSFDKKLDRKEVFKKGLICAKPKINGLIDCKES